MAAPLEDIVVTFVQAVFDNETLLQAERKQMITAAMLKLQRFVERGVDRNGMSMQIGSMIQDARRPRKKGRSEDEALGFFGNWAKDSIEKKDNKDAEL